jgi:hypothetical protein
LNWRALRRLGLIAVVCIACQPLTGESRDNDQTAQPAQPKPAPRPAPVARGRTPAPGPFTPQAVTGDERIQWRQDARTFQEVSAYQFVAYIDGVEEPLADAHCEPKPPRGPFYCSARLPSLSPGEHSIRIAAVADGTAGIRSRAVLVVKQSEPAAGSAPDR